MQDLLPRPFVGPRFASANEASQHHDGGQEDIHEYCLDGRRNKEEQFGHQDRSCDQPMMLLAPVCGREPRAICVLTKTDIESRRSVWSAG
jgi:hypothetical protein